MTDKVQCGLRLEESLLLKVRQLAKDHGITLNAQLSLIISSYVKDYEQIHGEIKVEQ